MAWDSARPVPWQRLIRDWLIYVAIMTVVLAIVYRDRLDIGLFGGLLVSGPIFVLVGAALAKLGYQRKTLKQLRLDSEAKAAARAAAPCWPPAAETLNAVSTTGAHTCTGAPRRCGRASRRCCPV